MRTPPPPSATPPPAPAPVPEVVERYYYDLLALVAIIEGRARGREPDAAFAAKVNPRHTPAGRRLCIQTRVQARRPDFAAAWARLPEAAQRTLREDGVFDTTPYVAAFDSIRPRWVAVAFGYQDRAHGDTFVLPEDVSAYTRALRTGAAWSPPYADLPPPPAGGTGGGRKGKKAGRKTEKRAESTKAFRVA